MHKNQALSGTRANGTLRCHSFETVQEHMGEEMAWAEIVDVWVGIRDVSEPLEELGGDIKKLANWIVKSTTPKGQSRRSEGVDGMTFQAADVSLLFHFHKETQISDKAARVVHTDLYGAKCFSFRCSQDRERLRKPKEQPLKHQRNRQSLKSFGCKGYFNVYFPPAGQPTFPNNGAQVAIRVYHPNHQGRPVSGVPANIRRWIKDNPRATAAEQRQECYHALRKGLIVGWDQHAFISPAHFHYWWTKAQVGVHRISDDPWENLEHRLKQDPDV